jgi:hypothetical protein
MRTVRTLGLAAEQRRWIAVSSDSQEEFRIVGIIQERQGGLATMSADYCWAIETNGTRLRKRKIRVSEIPEVNDD